MRGESGAGVYNEGRQSGLHAINSRGIGVLRLPEILLFEITYRSLEEETDGDLEQLTSYLTHHQLAASCNVAYPFKYNSKAGTHSRVERYVQPVEHTDNPVPR